MDEGLAGIEARGSRHSFLTRNPDAPQGVKHPEVRLGFKMLNHQAHEPSSNIATYRVIGS